MFEKDSLQYRNEPNGITITGWSDKINQLKIPECITNQFVTEIEERAFAEASWLTHIEFPESLQVIGDYSFCECRGLTKLRLPKGIKRVGRHAFYNCRNMQELTLRSDLRNIEDGAFKNCSQIHKVTLEVEDDCFHAISNLFDELLQNLTMILRFADGRKASLYFPRNMVQYSEYSNRLHNPVTYSMGYDYRQTVTLDEIHYDRYDRLFLAALNELPEEQLREIAVLRLIEPYQLANDMKIHYEEYVKTACLELIQDAIRKVDQERIDFLLDAAYLTENQAQDAYEYAKQQNQVEISAKILQYKTKNFKKINMDFEL